MVVICDPKNSTFNTNGDKIHFHVGWVESRRWPGGTMSLGNLDVILRAMKELSRGYGFVFQLVEMLGNMYVLKGRKILRWKHKVLWSGAYKRAGHDKQISGCKVGEVWRKDYDYLAEMILWKEACTKR